MLDEADRNYQSSGNIDCDKIHRNRWKSLKWDGPGWYRFTYPAGEKLSENVVEEYKCGSDETVWMNGTHPVNPGEQVTRTVCFGSRGYACNSSHEIKVHNCGSFYVYYLPDTPKCSIHYCAQ